MTWSSMPDAASPAIVLFSFRRPELTREALDRVLQDTDAMPIYVSIDGTASWSTNDDLEQRRLTIAVAEEAAVANGRIRPIIWDHGTGLTAHAIRILDLAFAQHEIVVSLEEDNLIRREGLDFLLQAVPRGGKSGLATAYSSFTHPSREIPFRLTAFPEQWATSLNRLQYLAFRGVAQKPRIRTEVIRAMALKSLDSHVLAEMAVRYWQRLLGEAAKSNSHGDALMQYAAWETRQFVRAPLVPLVEDLGYRHVGGLHARQGVPSAPRSHELQRLDADGGTICRTCERADLSRRLLRMKQTLYSRMRRT